MAAKGVELASAYISLSVNTKGVPQQVRNALRGIGDVNIDVDAETSSATSNMARWRAKEQANDVKIKVDVDTKRAGSQVRGLRRDLEELRRSDFLKLNLGAAGISALPAMATGLAEVAAAMQQVAQASLAIPGGIAGAVSSIGTLAFGLTGISDAYDAVAKASDEAATSGGDAASAARAQMSASNGLRNAVVDEAQARRDVARATRDARNELMDLNIEMRGGLISEKRAVLEAQKAREELMSGNFTDVRDQLLRIEEADQRVIETRARNAQGAEELADANAKGVANSDQVVGANERLVRSQQNVAEAHASVAAAVPTATAAQEAEALAMSKLHPEAQALVRTMRDLAQNQGLGLRNLVQGNVLNSVSGQLSGLANKVMPNLEKGLGGIGDAWNENILEVFKVLGKDDNISLLDRIFGNTAEAQSILTGTIDPLVEGVGVLTAAGTDALPRLADAFVGVSERFANFITEADKDGRLDKWIDEGITALGDLGETALNVGKMFTGITGAADGGFLPWLREVTDSWQTWINSVEGQTAIKDFFAEGKRVWEEWRPILEDLPGLFKGIYDAASTYTGLLLKALDPVTSLLGEHPGLVEAAAYAYIAFKALTIGQGALAVLTTSLTAINKMLGVTLPASASKAGGALSGALTGPGTAVVLGSWGVDALLGKMDELFGTDVFKKYGEIPGSGAWFFNKLFGDGGSILPDVSGSGMGPFNPSQPGVPAVTGMGPGNVPGPLGPGVAGESVPGQGVPGRNPLGVITGSSDPREFAHSSMMPFWQNQGFTVGDHQADKYGEHQNGALDIMVDSIEEGNKVLQQVLQDPNVYGAIFNNQSFGYGQGADPRPYSGGFTGDPTQDHQDHVHAWYKPGGDNNIAPMPAPPLPPASQASQPPAPPGLPAQQPGSMDEYWKRILGGATTFDEGGWLAPGMTLANNATGKPEMILTPEQIQQMAQMGIDPNTLQHGTGAGAPIGPPPTGGPQPGGVDPSVEQQFGFGSQPGDMNFSGRTEGYIPAGAGFSGKTGGGVAGSLVALGGEAAKGAIQMAADLGKMAASAAAAGATGGGGAAAGPAAGAGIQIAADIAKRGVDWGVDMANIGIGAATEILFPFGAPRWLSDVDATAFMPQMGISPALTTTTEQMAQQALMPGQAPPMPPNGQHMPPGAQPGVPVAPGPAPGPAVAQAGPAGPPPTPPQPAQQPPAPTSSFNATDPSSWMNIIGGGIFDQGGILQPNTAAINLSSRPEAVFTQAQLKGMEANASQAPVGSATYNVYGNSLDEALRELKKKERRNSRPQMNGKAGL